MPESDTSKPLPPLPNMSNSESYNRPALEHLLRAAHSNNSGKNRPEPIYWKAEDRRHLWTAMLKSARRANDRRDFTDLQSWKGIDSSENFSGGTVVSAERNKLSPSDGTLTPQQLSVQELRQLVFVINQQWRKKLLSKPDLSYLCSNRPDQSLFERGIVTLQRFFQGCLVNDFTDVFALTHVAMASAYLLHREEELYRWDDLFVDMYIWRYTIVEERDLILFTRVMHSFGMSDSFTEVPGTYGLSDSPSADQLFEMLNCGHIIENCSSFLDSKLAIIHRKSPAI